MEKPRTFPRPLETAPSGTQVIPTPRISPVKAGLLEMRCLFVFTQSGRKAADALLLDVF